MLPRGARRYCIAERRDCVTMLSSEFSTEDFCSLDNRLNLCFIVEQRVGRVVKWIIGIGIIGIFVRWRRAVVSVILIFSFGGYYSTTGWGGRNLAVDDECIYKFLQPVQFRWVYF